MKTALIWIFFIFSFQTIFSQTWSPAGAKWTYGTLCGGSCNGIVELTYSGDTVINSINCKKLLKTISGQYVFDTNLFHDTLGTEITYEQNGVVYIQSSNNFDTLYNFKALIGDSWKMPRQCDGTSRINVIDTGTIIINAIHLKFQVVNLHFNSSNFPSDYQDTIIEKIGFIASYFIASDFCYAPLDGAQGGAFKCYSDDSFSTYKSNWTTSCTFTVGMEEIENETLITLFPNPAHSTISINTSKNYPIINTIALYNSFGQIVLTPMQLNNIDISELSPGLYFFKLMNNKGETMITKFLKV